MNTPVIIAAGRTPIGAFNGSLSSLSAVQLGTQCLQGILSKNPSIHPADIDEVILGQVLTAGCGQNPARQTALFAGLPKDIPAYTINKVCASGLKSVQLAAQAIRCGDAKLIVAGGQESMSQAPHIVPHSRQGKRMGSWNMLDSMMKDGLEDAFGKYPMGITAENLAKKFSISREEQDAFATSSQQKVEQSRGFTDEIIPIHVPRRKDDDIIVAQDEQPRNGVTEKSLATLKPAFAEGGTVTVGNASTINDGAAMILVAEKSYAQEQGFPILATITSTGTSGVAPDIMGIGPVTAIQNCLEKAAWSLSDLELIELNEAFAVQSLSVIKELGLQQNICNPRGGAIALGHPIGASGCRILVSLLSEMQYQDKHKGLASLCVGGGMGIAVAIERE